MNEWILKDKFVLRAGQILGVKENLALEDLFDEEYYLTLTQAAYATELGGKKLVLKSKHHLPLVERVAEALKQAGIAEFNKGRVAKRIMDDLAKKKISDFPPTTVNNFIKVIAAINSIVQGWQKR